MLKHYHIFEYRVEEGCQAVPKQNIRFEIDGDSDLYEILEKFNSYLISAGFCFGENQRVGIVEGE